MQEDLIYNSEYIDIGKEIEAVAIKQKNKNTWLGFCKTINPKFELLLIVSKYEKPYVGYINKYKIIEITQTTVKASNIIAFGQKNITPRSRMTYINKIDDFLSIDISSETQRALPLKRYFPVLSMISMFFRTKSKLKHPTRFAILEGLGNPSEKECSEILEIYEQLKMCIHTNNIEMFYQEFDKLRQTTIYTRLNSFKKFLMDSFEKLEEPIGIRKKGNEIKITNDIKKRILSDIEKEKLNWANSEHEKTLKILMDKLKEYKYIPEENVLIDCFAVLKSGPAIFEIKSITSRNELSQVRHAVSQLYEYRFRHNLPKASLWIVFSEKPKTEWLLEYLLNDRKINILWIEYNVIVGPSLTKLIK